MEGNPLKAKSSVVADHSGPATWAGDPREHLAKLQGLLVLGHLMSKSRDEDEVLRLASSSVSSLAPLRLPGIHMSGTGWYEPVGAHSSPAVGAGIEDQLAGLTGAGGALSLPGHG